MAPSRAVDSHLPSAAGSLLQQFPEPHDVVSVPRTGNEDYSSCRARSPSNGTSGVRRAGSWTARPAPSRLRLLGRCGPLVQKPSPAMRTVPPANRRPDHSAGCYGQWIGGLGRPCRAVSLHSCDLSIPGTRGQVVYEPAQPVGHIGRHTVSFGLTDRAMRGRSWPCSRHTPSSLVPVAPPPLLVRKSPLRTAWDRGRGPSG